MIPVKPRIVIISMIVFMALNLAYLPFERYDYVLYPFRLNPKQYTYLTNVIDTLAGRFGSILYIGGVVFYYCPKFRSYIAFGLLFWIGWVVDYWLTYNNPKTFFYFIPTSYSFWGVVCLLTWLRYDYYINRDRAWMK